MAEYEIQAPDGRTIVLEGPENATDEELLSAAQSAYEQLPPLVPTDGELSRGQGDAAPLREAFTQRGLGVAATGLDGIVGDGGIELPAEMREILPPGLEATLTTAANVAGGLGGLGEAGYGFLVGGLGDLLVEAGLQDRSEAESLSRDLMALPEALAGPMAGFRRATQGVSRNAMGRASSTIDDPEGGPLFSPSKVLEGAPMDQRRQSVASQLPVPLTGESALTKGQATRNFEQIKFEREAAKLGELGGPLRRRFGNQTATILQNFDALVELRGPISLRSRDIGQSVSKAIENKFNIQKQKVRKAYKEAEDAGHMQEPVSPKGLASFFNENISAEGVAPIITAARKEARRLGIVQGDEGSVIPLNTPINQMETLRKFINTNTNWADPQSAFHGRSAIDAIDAATEEAGGDLYRKARKLRKQQADEFERTGLVSRILGTKGKTTERKVALEDVFDSAILKSSLDEMNKFRSTLLRAGDEGKQTWMDLTAKGIDHIIERGFSSTQKDEFGNPLILPARLHKAVTDMDKSGKLESLYGKRQAQLIRDLADLSVDIFSAPPGAVNTSNTSSALLETMRYLASKGESKLPRSAQLAMKGALGLASDTKVKYRIAKALEGK